MALGRLAVVRYQAAAPRAAADEIRKATLTGPSDAEGGPRALVEAVDEGVTSPLATGLSP
jgi:hypothetical protein